MILLINLILSKYQTERISHLLLSMTLKSTLLMNKPLLSIESLLDSTTNFSVQTYLSPNTNWTRMVITAAYVVSHREGLGRIHY